ncbi:MAG: glycosyltransferase [Candidatus Scalindua sp.]
MNVMLLNRAKYKIRNYFDYFVIANSDLFDKEYYLTTYSNFVSKNPITHFILEGCNAGLKPNPEFNPEGYLYKNPDVARSGMNPLVHYIRSGKSEGRTWYSDFQSGHTPGSAFSSKHHGLAYIERHIENLKSIYSGGIKPAPRWLEKKVLIVTDLGLPQCVKYRVLQKIEAFFHADIPALYLRSNDVVGIVNSMFECTTVIFFRLVHSKELVQYIELAKLLGVKAIYDIDDPLFDVDAYTKNRNLDTLSKSEKKGILGNIGLYQKAILSFDQLFVSTPGMQVLASENGAKETIVWRNALDSETKAAARYALRNKCNRENEIRIFYGSGSRAHDLDFEVVKNVLANLLSEHKNLCLVVVGYAILGRKLSRFGKRVIQLPYLGIEDYLKEIADSDIVIIPLLLDRFNSAKSAVRFIESSAVNVPVVASKTADFINLIVDGENGFLAENAEEWLAKLTRLIQSQQLRSETGKNASIFVAENLNINHVAKEVLPFIK